VITLPEYDVTKTTFTPGYICFSWPNHDHVVDKSLIYGVLAAPKCTEFSFLNNALPNKEPNYKKGMELVTACIEIIQKIQEKNIPLKFWALENPKGYLRRFLGKPSLEFDPCDYGDPWTKRTDLWGFFNNPKQKPVKPTNTRFARQNPTLSLPAGYVKPPDMIDNRACRRAITPPGFAQAFFKANK
jgi:hypothetical protein